MLVLLVGVGVVLLNDTVSPSTFRALRVYCCTMYDMTAHFAWLKQNKTALTELVSYLTFDLELLHIFCAKLHAIFA